MELVRAILFAVEAHPNGFAPQQIEISGYTPEQIGYHATLLKEANLVEAVDSTTYDDSGPMAIVTRLTWHGHEFIEASRSPAIWSQAKDLMHKAGGGSFAIWQAVLTELVKRSLGLG
jgi:hypothetical protein